MQRKTLFAINTIILTIVLLFAGQEIPTAQAQRVIVYFRGTPQKVSLTDTVTLRWKVIGRRYVRIAWFNPQQAGMIVKSDLPAEGQMTVRVSDVGLQSDAIQFDLWATDTPDGHGADANEVVAFVFIRVDLGIRIKYFKVSPRVASLGETVTLSWSVTGVNKVDIVIPAGKLSIKTIGENLPLTGTLKYEMREPSDLTWVFTLCLDNECSFEHLNNDVEIYLRCGNRYFFGGNKPCPETEATTAQGTLQTFENGRMLWLPYNLETDERSIIYVLYANGRWRGYQDSWAQGEAIQPTEVPPGRFLPTQGFGKLWTQNADVRQKLGWATAPEQGYTVNIQPIGGCIAYSLPDGQPVFLNSRSKRWSLKRTIC